MIKHSTSPGSSSEDESPLRLEELGLMIREKRRVEHLTLEEAAKQSGLSSATLSRLERRTGSVGWEMPTPDVRTLGAVMKWLGISATGTGFAPLPPVENISVPNRVEAHLRADRNLDPQTAALLARMFRAAYSEFAGAEPKESLDLGSQFGDGPSLKEEA